MCARPRVCYVASSELTVTAFLAGHIIGANEIFDVSVAANSNNPNLLRDKGIPATLVPVPILRHISFLRDISALISLVRLFSRTKFTIIHSISPKAGLLGMAAAWVARTPFRIHTFTGQVWATKVGWRRTLLRFADRILASLTTHALVDSFSQRDFLITERIVRADKVHVIGNGSICGVDTERFRPNPIIRSDVRQNLGISESAHVILYLGRLTTDKGVLDLIRSLPAIVATVPDVILLLVGPDEGGLGKEALRISSELASKIRYIGFTEHPEQYMAAADILCLPSYREGFGMVLIEAGAVELPVVASKIYGITDAVIEGKTGLLHPPGDLQAIEAAVIGLLQDPERRIEMGKASRSRVLRDFSKLEITRNLIAFYGKIISP